MADTTLHHNSDRSFGQSITAFFAAIGRGLVMIGENSGRYRRLQALNAMSDEQLAKRGLRREDIVRHVFSDVFYA